jgi:hypothetical protein
MYLFSWFACYNILKDDYYSINNGIDVGAFFISYCLLPIIIVYVLYLSLKEMRYKIKEFIREKYYRYKALKELEEMFN